MEERQLTKKMGYDEPVDIPIEVIVHVDTDHEMTPLRVRYEDTEGKLVVHTFSKDDVVASCDCNFVGIKVKKFICTSVKDGVRTTMELRCRMADQEWRLYRFL